MAAGLLWLQAMATVMAFGSAAPMPPLGLSMPPRGLSMVQAREDKAGGPIQTLPRTTVHDEVHEKEVEKLKKQAKKKTVRHDEKLENKIFRLKLQVKELSTELEKEERQEAMEEAKKNALEKLEGDKPEMKVEKEEEEAEEKIKQEVGKASAFMIFGSIILCAYLFFMANHGDKQVSLWFWHTAENIVIIFLAVLWFQAFDDILEVHGFATHHKVWAALLHVAFIFLIVVGLIWTVKDRHRLLTAYTGIGAHYVAFAAMHFSISAQQTYFSMSPLFCFVSVLLVFVIVAGVSVGLFYLKARLFNESADEDSRLHHQDFEDGVDEIENIVGAGILAVTWTMAIRYAIMGRPPTMTLQDSSTDHSALQRGLFLGYALIVSALAAFLLPKLEDWLRDEAHAASHVTTHLMLLASPFLTMSVAWAYLLWAEFEFHEFLFWDNRVLGCILFAVLATFVCFSLVLALAKWNSRKRHPDLDRTDNPKLREFAQIEEQIQLEREAELRKTVVTMLALIIGYSWAATMNITLSDSVGRTAHPALFTAGVAVFGAALVLPLYIYYLRPFVENLEHSVVESRL